MSEIITHLARFISKLWQIHIFGEGNTRTSAVFFIKYIRSLGFHATNDVFANNSWYFRNALVRANYTNLSLGVREDLSFLELFLRNLLMGEKNELKNRYMHIAWKETTHSNNKRHIERHIEQHIDPKGAIKQLEIILDTNVVSERTKSNILNLFNEFGYEKIFSRGDVIKSLGITEKPASTLVKRMYELGITEKMIGVVKGKYRFIWN